MSDSKIAEKFVKHLEESLAGNLKDSIERMIDRIVEKRFSSLVRQVDSLQKTVDQLQADLKHDREEFQKIRIDNDHMASQLREILSIVNRMPEKIENKVENTVNNSVAEAVPQAVSDTFDIVGKKVSVQPKKRFYFI